MQPAFKSLNHALEAAASSAPDKGYIFLSKQGANKLNYKDLYEQAIAKAKQCQSLGIGLNSKVLLTIDKGPTFTVLYYALLLSGAIPCVLPPVKATNQLARQKLKDIAEQIEASHIIHSQILDIELSGLDLIHIDDFNDVDVSESFEVKTNEVALIQCSSGTTAKPKCLALSHQKVLVNLEQMRQRLDVPRAGDDVMVSWLPLHHDMGLIGCFLASMYGQIDCVQMTAFQFLRKPESWLKAISDYKGTLSSAPNFAYALATQKTSDVVLEELDLSSWRSAMCGAEQINYKTLIEFSNRFEPFGFSPNALTPCYGLAEAALSVSMHVVGTPMSFEVLQRANTEHSTTVVNCGKAVEGTDIQIRNEKGTVLPEKDMGEIWVRGPSIIDEYINLPEENENRFVDGWFKTGDLGYLKDSHLYITGRKKEVIIIRGNNYSPTEFEWVANEVPGVAFGKVVAFSLFDEAAATELLHIVFERDKQVNLTQSDVSLAQSVRMQVAKQTSILPHVVEVLPKNTITKTTSGKLQRLKIVEQFAFKALEERT